MEFDKLVHQPTRLRIFTHLYAQGETSFSDLRQVLEVTQGNLSSHLQKMEEAECIHVAKTFVDRKPLTTYRLTDKGRRMLEKHIQLLEALIQQLDP